MAKSEENLLIMDHYTTETYFDDYFNFTFRETSTHYVNASEVEFTNTTRAFGWGDVALVSLFCSIIAGTVAGNALVIAAVVTTRRLRTVTNCFVMSLAVADWLVGMFVMPPKVALFLVNNEWRLGNVTCELWISLDILLCTASILSLCAISIDRYLAITRPLAYSRRRRSKRLALSMISCVWVAAVVITSPPIFGWYDSNRNDNNKCDYNEDKGYVVYSALGSFFIPLSVMLYVYARIACVIANRQKTMQKLSSSDRFDSTKSCPNDAEEPLRQNRDPEIGGVEMVRSRGRSGCGVSASDPEATATTGFGGDHQRVQTSPSTSSTTTPNPNTNQSSQSKANNRGFWEKLGINSCTKGNSRANNGKGKHDKNQRSFASGAGQRSGTIGSSDSETNSGTIAISVPHPSTLAGSLMEGSSGPGNEGNISTCGSSPGNSLHRYHHHQFSRMRTGSRLCHHSVATTSPQRSIHRVHQTASASGRIFSEDEIVPICGTNSLNMNPRLDVPRVWTVEETSSALSSLAANKSKSLSSNGRLDSFSQSELDGRRGSYSLGRVGSSGNTAASSTISPGISAPNIAASGDNGGGRLGNRIYQPQSLHGHHGNHMQSGLGKHGQNQPPNANVSRRSMKLNVNVHGNQDQNQNAREFMSGRVASFKRETKTARTLAAVVGGFIICWLPFFVAYVVGPFMPSGVTIPTALMDALIWLGWGNSAINPLIYSFYSADFRSAFWRLTIHKCEGLVRNNPDRCSPRRYDENTQMRMSA